MSYLGLTGAEGPAGGDWGGGEAVYLRRGPVFLWVLFS